MTIIEAVENFRKAWADFKQVTLKEIDKDLHITQILEWVLRHMKRAKEGK